MLSQIVHNKQSAIGQYYKQIDMEDQDLTYYSKQTVESELQINSNEQQPLKTPKWLKPLLKLFFGRKILIQRVLRHNQEAQESYLMQNLIILLGLIIYIVVCLIALTYGVGNLLAIAILSTCVYMYLSQVTEAKLEDVLRRCAFTSVQWQTSYRSLYKYIREIEIVYAQISLKEDKDFEALLTVRDEPMQKRFTRPRIACLEIRNMLVTQIRKIQANLLAFLLKSSQANQDLNLKFNVQPLLNLQTKPTGYYSLQQIKEFYSTLSLLRYQVRQVMTFLILNPSVPTMLVYQSVQTIKQLEECQRQSSMAQLAMLECYQHHLQSNQQDKGVPSPRVEIVQYSKQRTHLLNVYYNQFLESEDSNCIDLALNELKGISLCLSTLSRKSVKKPYDQGLESQTLGDTDGPNTTIQVRRQQQKQFYLNDQGQTILTQRTPASQITTALEQLLRHEPTKIKPQVQSLPDQRMKFDFLSELRSVVRNGSEQFLQ